MKYFKLSEFTNSVTANKLQVDNTPPPAARARITALVANVLDPLRAAWGGPITVTSGYRCPKVNAAVGGSKTSQHMTGEAADITTGSVAGNKKLFALIRNLNLPFDQLIDENGYAWVHVSHRSGANRKAVLRAKQVGGTWVYTRLK